LHQTCFPIIGGFSFSFAEKESRFVPVNRGGAWWSEVEPAEGIESRYGAESITEQGYE